MKRILYFAYGSNLNIEQMQFRCPAAKPLSAAHLADHRLVFRGVADIIPAPDHLVQGGIWSITPRCEEALDRYEGVSSRLYRREWVTVDGNECLTYMMNGDYLGVPSKGYLSTIITGYEDFGLNRNTTLRAAVAEALEARAAERRHWSRQQPTAGRITIP